MIVATVYKTPTPYWDTTVLVRSLRSAGWGVLSDHSTKGVRNVLVALTDFTNEKTGVGKSTAFQISIHAGLSERWTRHCLHVLEDMGLLVWKRGIIACGDGYPSTFTINKKILCELIKHARTLIADVKTNYKRKVIARIEKIKTKWAKGKESKKVDYDGIEQLQQELSASHSFKNKNKPPTKGLFLIEKEFTKKRNYLCDKTIAIDGTSAVNTAVVVLDDRFINQPRTLLTSVMR